MFNPSHHTSQGEEQKKLDVVTNDVIKRALKFTGKVGVIASEEEDAPVFNKDAYRLIPRTRYSHTC